MYLNKFQYQNNTNQTNSTTLSFTLLSSAWKNLDITESSSKDLVLEIKK